MKYRLLLTIPLLITLTACQGGQIRRTLEKAEAVMDDSPQTALAILDSIPGSRISNRAQKAKYALLYAMAQEKCFIDVQNDSIIAPAVKYYDKHGSPDDRLKVYYYAGRIQQNAGNFLYATYDMLEAERSGRSSDDYFHRGMVAVALAIISNDTYNPDEGIAYSEQAISYFRQADKPRHEGMARLHKGVILKNSGRLDEAAAILEAVLEDAEAGKDTVLLKNAVISLVDNMISMENPDFSKVIKIYERIMTEFPEAMTCLDYCNYAFVLYHGGNKGAAEDLLEELSLYDKTREEESDFYYICYDVLKNEGQADRALEYLEKANAIHEAIVEEAMEMSFVRSQRNFLNDKAEIVESRVRTQRIVLILVAALILLAVGLLVFLVGRQLAKREAQKMSLLGTITDYERKNKDIGERLAVLKDDFKKAYRAKFDVVSTLYEKSLTAGQRVDGEELILKRTQEILGEFKKEMQSTHLLEERVNNDLENIMTKLRKDFPKMKQQDMDLIMYQLVGLDTMMIASLLGVEPNTVHSRRFRIKNRILASDSPNRQFYLDMIF